jgi:menaquinone-dependent protoporphyrinogen IX oxidase
VETFSKMVALVIYGGNLSTREIAKQLVDRLESIIPPAIFVSPENVVHLEKYSVIIIGSAIRGSRWLPSVTSLLQANADVLSKKPVWAFSVARDRGLPRFVAKRWAAWQEKRLSKIITREILVQEHRMFVLGETRKLSIGSERESHGNAYTQDINRWADHIAIAVKNLGGSKSALNLDQGGVMPHHSMI